MLALLSPAKKLDPTPLTAMRKKLPLATPRYLTDAASLAATAKKLSTEELAGLMDLSEELAELNRGRFKVWKKAHVLGENDAKPAILAFAGDVYTGLDASTLKNPDLEWMNEHLFILSGLYGVLRPLDLMQPYRLEMGSKLSNKKGKDLYTFWGDKLAKTIDQALAEHPAEGRFVLNLASQEYFKAVPKKALKSPVVDVAFKEIKDGKAVALMLFAKRARGMMARFMTTQRVDRPEGLKDFDLGDYRFDKAASTEREWVFTRPYRTVAMLDD
ncbi:MAG TPA: peroxide stress protein YaaA [Myxococcota bacterium]|nr:peroxide stress protein YaaA [Myxococcota bacterium]